MRSAFILRKPVEKLPLADRHSPCFCQIKARIEQQILRWLEKNNPENPTKDTKCKKYGSQIDEKTG